MLIGGFHGLILLSLQTIMANDFFKFRQFTISQQRCAMKVGTDGTLLGAWARTSCQGDSEKSRILDIGTGTGLIALMMAQRYPNAVIKAIDIDENAVCQARENVSVSPFSTRIEVIQADIALFESDESFDAIVCNPPYFTAANSMESPDFQRRIARQTHSLDFKMLVNSVKRLLASKGLFSVVIPTDGYAFLIVCAIASITVLPVTKIDLGSLPSSRRFFIASLVGAKLYLLTIETACLLNSSGYGE